MKKFLLSLLILLGLGTLTACQLNFDPVYGEHEHQPKTELAYNTKIHWVACETCDEKIDKTWHNFGPWGRVSEDSLEEIRTCECGYFESRFHEHTLTGNVLYDDKEHYDECATCFDHVNAVAHTYGEWTTVRESTEDVEGYEQQVCSCGHTVYHALPLKNHEHHWDGTYGITETAHWKNCVKDSCTKDEVDLLVPHNGGVATCTEDAVCVDCGHHYEDAFGHDYASVVTLPTCTEDGYTTHTCKNDATHIYVDSHVDKLGHDYTSVVTLPTCTEKGYTTYTCKNDTTHTYVADYVDALGHTPLDAVEENIVPATCTEKGSYDSVVYCDVCDEELSREPKTIDELGHDYTSVVTPPTCTEKGYTTYTCKENDHTYVADYVDATGHAYGTPSYTWTDYAKVTATRVCTNDTNHVETETVDTVYTVPVEPDKLTVGTGRYTATFVNTAFAVQTKDVEIPATGVTYTTSGTGTNVIYDEISDTYYFEVSLNNWGWFQVKLGGKLLSVDKTKVSGLYDGHNGTLGTTSTLYGEESDLTKFYTPKSDTYIVTYNATTDALYFALKGSVYYIFNSNVPNSKTVVSGLDESAELSFALWGNITFIYETTVLTSDNISGNFTIGAGFGNSLYVDKAGDSILWCNVPNTFKITANVVENSASIIVDFVEDPLPEGASALALTNIDAGYTADTFIVWTSHTKVREIVNGTAKWNFAGGYAMFCVVDSNGKVAYLVNAPDAGYGYDAHSYYAHPDYQGANSVVKDVTGGWEIVIPEGGFAITAHGTCADQFISLLSAGKITSATIETVNEQMIISNKVRLAYDADNYRIVLTNSSEVEIEGYSYEIVDGNKLRKEVKAMTNNGDGTYSMEVKLATSYSRILVMSNDIPVDLTKLAITGQYGNWTTSVQKGHLYVDVNNDGPYQLISATAGNTYILTYNPEANTMTVGLKGFTFGLYENYGHSTYDETHKVYIAEITTTRQWEPISFYFDGYSILPSNTSISGLYRASGFGSDWTGNLYHEANSDGVVEYDIFWSDQLGKTYKVVYDAETKTMKIGLPTDSIEHSWNEATCTLPKTCSVCGTTEGVALDHDYKSEVTPPTCTEKGYTTYTCTRGDHTYKDDYVDELGHSWNAATCEKAKTCQTCGAPEGNALGHDPSEVWTTDTNGHWHTCGNDENEKLDYAAHVFNKEVVSDDYKVSDATHLVKAKYYYSCECGATGSEVFENGSTYHKVVYAQAYNGDTWGDGFGVFDQAGKEIKSGTSNAHADWVGTNWRMYVVVDAEGKICYAVVHPVGAGVGTPNETSYYHHPDYTVAHDSDNDGVYSTNNPAVQLLDGFAPWSAGTTNFTQYKIVVPEGGFALSAHGTGVTELVELLTGKTGVGEEDARAVINNPTAINENVRLHLNNNLTYKGIIMELIDGNESNSKSIIADVADVDGGADKASLWTDSTYAISANGDWLGGGWRMYLVVDATGKIAYSVVFTPNGYGTPNETCYYHHPIYDVANDSDNDGIYTTNNPAIQLLDGFKPYDGSGNHTNFKIVIPEGGFGITAHGTGIEKVVELLTGHSIYSSDDAMALFNDNNALNFDFVRLSMDKETNEITFEVIEPETLETPVVSISNDGIASWSAVNGAAGYIYKINGGTETFTTNLSVQLEDEQTIVVKAAGNIYDYIDGEYTEEVKYVAPPKTITTSYSYTFEKNVITDFGKYNLNGARWTIQGVSSYFGAVDSNKGLQFGKSAEPNTSLSLTSIDSFVAYAIVINTSGASSIIATCSVSVGETVVGTFNLTSTATEYVLYINDLDESLSGEISISYTQTSSKAIYIKYIEVISSKDEALVKKASDKSTDLITTDYNSDCTIELPLAIEGVSLNYELDSLVDGISLEDNKLIIKQNSESQEAKLNVQFTSGSVTDNRQFLIKVAALVLEATPYNLSVDNLFAGLSGSSYSTYNGEHVVDETVFTTSNILKKSHDIGLNVLQFKADLGTLSCSNVGCNKIIITFVDTYSYSNWFTVTVGDTVATGEIVSSVSTGVTNSSGYEYKKHTIEFTFDALTVGKLEIVNSSSNARYIESIVIE